MRAAPVFEACNHRWWVLYDQDERRVIDSNVYIVESNGESVILDPGGFEIFPQVLATVAEVVAPSSVVKAFASHQPLGGVHPALRRVECRNDRSSRRGEKHDRRRQEAEDYPGALSACFSQSCLRS